MSEIPTIIIPNQPRNDIHNHCNDTFRELVKLWNKNGYCRIKLSDNPYVWWGNIGEVLLYDRPTLEFLQPNHNYRLGLFGNPKPPINEKNNCLWTFWARRPELLEKKIKDKINKHSALRYDDSYLNRSIESIFLGKIENNVQYNYRAGQINEWDKVVEVFEIPINGEYKYSQSEYLDLISNSKFGLCLRGYGPKCNREIELMAFGTVPLITSDVDITGYYEPLIENIHYLYVKNPKHLSEVIEKCDEEKWEQISKNCREWYQRNCSPKGSFDLTKKIIEENI